MTALGSLCGRLQIFDTMAVAQNHPPWNHLQLAVEDANIQNFGKPKLTL
jgi:hypothetical protein